MDMQYNNTTIRLVEDIWEFINYSRGKASVIEIYPSILYLLYGIHKRYPIRVESNKGFFIDANGDRLLDDLRSFVWSREINIDIYDFKYHLERFYAELSDCCYSEVLSLLNHRVSLASGKYSSDFSTPKGLNWLISYFIKQENCQSVFDPFCGTASILQLLKNDNPDITFVGQELDTFTSLIARVNAEAITGKDIYIKKADSLREWEEFPYDAVASCPPLNMKLADSQKDFLRREFDWNVRTLEEVFFHCAFTRNHPRLVVGLTSTGFSFRESGERFMREIIVEENLLDTVISLPSNLLYGTSVPCLLIVCKRGREQGAPIKFVNADSYFKGNNKLQRVFDFPRFKSDFESDNSDIVSFVSSDTIRLFNYNLNPELYRKKRIEIKEGQKAYTIKEIMTLEDGIRVGAHPEGSYIKPSLMSKDFIQVLLNRNKYLPLDGEPGSNRFKLFEPENGKSYLVVYEGRGDMKFYLHTDDKPFYCYSNMKVYSANEDVLSVEYLAYILSNEPAIINSGMSITSFYQYPVVIDSKENQAQIIGRLARLHNEKVKAEHEADERRLGIKTNISDLEHMLGSTQMKINNIIEHLSEITPSHEGYNEIVKQLKDNVDYMNRIIHFNNASIEKESFNLKDYNLLDYLNAYASSWNNYGGNYFTLSITPLIESNMIMRFDKALFTVMLDSILSNAVRHGFHKRKNYTPDNKVDITLTLESYKDNPYLVMRVANNGDAMSDNFTIEDYITRGRYSSNTGRSGLGGNHVYQIVKGHQGYLALDSNKVWNMIVEILLPVSNVDVDKIKEYEHECI